MECRQCGGTQMTKFPKSNFIKKIKLPSKNIKVPETKKSFALIMPAVIWMGLFFVIPLFLVVAVSFLTRGEYGNIEYKFNLNNYARIFNPLYLKIFWDSLVSAFLTTLLCLVFGYPFAYIIGKSSKNMKPVLLMLIILPFWTNSLVRTYAWIILLRTEGIINSYLMALGLIYSPLHLLYNEAAVMLGMFYIMFPFMVLPIYAQVEKLDKNLIEAASDLYASPAKTFLKVTLPLTKPGVMAGCFLVFVPTLGLFFIPDLMGGSKVIFISNLIRNQFLTARDWPFGMAISVLLIIVMLVMVKLYTHKNGKIEADGGLL